MGGVGADIIRPHDGGTFVDTDCEAISWPRNDMQIRSAPRRGGVDPPTDTRTAASRASNARPYGAAIQSLPSLSSQAQHFVDKLIWR